MPGRNAYRTPIAQDPPSDEDDNEEDDDLKLHELDPLSSSRAANSSTSAPGALNLHNSSGALGRKIALRTLKTKRTRANGHRTEEFERRKSPALDTAGYGPSDSRDMRPHSGSLGAADNVPLLLNDEDTAEQSPVGNGRPQQDSDGHFSNLLKKLRSTPQSEIEEGFDPGSERNVVVGKRQNSRYPQNLVSNAKYTPWSFLPRTLYHEFSFFLNMYFLLVALSQIIPQLRIGYLSTYIAPLAFVLTITLGKEAYDDITRRRRDAEANSERYVVLRFEEPKTNKKVKKRKWSKAQKEDQRRPHRPSIGEEEQDIESEDMPTVTEVSKMSSSLRVGDVVKLAKDQRVPADIVLLQSIAVSDGDEAESTGEAFIRTDQLDGETDWKLRLAPALSQNIAPVEFSNFTIEAGKPDQRVNNFAGALVLHEKDVQGDNSRNNTVPLTIDNTAWANTVIASSGNVYGVVLYTGPQTRQALSTSSSRSKTGLLDYEINSLTKILCFLTVLLSLVLVALEQAELPDDYVWYVAALRFLILFSTIVPISLRVNLDLGKSVYAWFIHRDKDIPGTVVRSSTIPEDLGRIEYLLSDKTGTLTQNDMQLRKIHVGTVSYANEAMSEVRSYVRQGFSGADPNFTSATRSKREIGSRVRDLVLALAVCHNVTPTPEEENGEQVTTYQASSPDEIAIVRWTESVGLRLAHRDRQRMVLESQTGEVVATIEILNLFPFTSEGKRMGIVVRYRRPEESEDSTWFFQKGADTVMTSIVAANDWLDEETANMAREGLRTLVIGRRRLSNQQYQEFCVQFREASLSLHCRDENMSNVIKEYLEHDLELLGVTGVEDKLQQDVKPSLELLRNAGVKVWMLTGDKVETARCVAVSSKLVARGQYVHTIVKIKRNDQAADALDFLRSKPDSCMLIDGDSLALMLSQHREAFISVAVRLSAVIACRCSPMQKAEVAKLIRTYTKKRVCCIGDGGNDVSMIQAADVGVGIVGKEGRQASLAADFSIDQFHYLTKLLMWHGRNSYKRSAKLAQFVIHRGLIISVCQTVYSIALKGDPKALYLNWLMVGYATVYTMAPVFSLVLDTDIPPQLAHLYPELYAELSTSRSLSYRTFFIWVAISIYQGCGIQILAQMLCGTEPDDFPRMVSVSYTVVVINELVMVAAEVTTWHWGMLAAIFGTAGLYFGSLPLLGEYFDLAWIKTVSFWWRVAAIASISLVPVYAAKILRRTIRPPSYRRVQQGI